MNQSEGSGTSRDPPADMNPQAVNWCTIASFRGGMRAVGRYCKARSRSIGLLVVVVFGLSLYANSSHLIDSNPRLLRFFPPFREGVNRNFNGHLGAEYFAIATALAEGRGFSNPFGVATGPTAWMPPVYPSLLAVMLKAAGSRELLALGVVILQNLVWVLSGLVVCGIARRTLGESVGRIALGCYTLLLLTNFWWFFQITHDCWLVMLCVDLLLLAACGLAASGITWKRAVGWGALGGVGVLTSPVVGFAWGALTARAAAGRCQGRAWLLAALGVMVACFSAWGVRNYAVLGRFIPVKSNLYFDLCHNNLDTPDGLVDEKFLNGHPFHTTAGEAGSPYRLLGEMAFMDEYRQRFWSEIGRNPRLLARNILNRFNAALLVYHPYHDDERLVPLKHVVHVLPTLGLVLALASRAHRRLPAWRIAVVLYLSYLTPYILFSYYIRYAIPLTPLKALFVVWGLDAVLGARLGWRTASGKANPHRVPPAMQTTTT